MSNNELDNLFKESLQHLEEKPNDRVWGKVLSELNGRPSPSETKSFLRMVYGGIGFLLISIPLCYWLFSSTNQPMGSTNAATEQSVTPTVKSEQTASTLENQTLFAAADQQQKENSSSFDGSSNHGGKMKPSKQETQTQQTQKEPRKHNAKSRSKSNTTSSKAAPKRFTFNGATPSAKSPMVQSQPLETNVQTATAQLPYGSVQLPASADYINSLPLRKMSKVGELEEGYIQPKLEREKSEIPQNYYNLKGLHLGVIGAINTVWILNQNTYGQFGKYEMAYKIKLGYHFGGEIGYDITNHFGIQAEYHYRSAQGQDYADRIKRVKYNRSVDLEYQNFPLLFKIKSPSISGEFDRPSCVNFLVGLQYSYLKMAKQKLNAQESYITERFRKHDIGAIIGVEYNAYLANHLFFSAGIRGTFGLIDMNSKEWENPTDEGKNSSHNAIIGLNLGLHYKLF
jgi:hypothetical protein